MQGDSEMAGRQLDAMRNNVFPSGLLNYKDAGVTLEMQPREQVHGRPVIVIRATPKTGAPTRLYFDAETYLLVQTVATVDSPDGSAIEQTGELSDYRTVDGVKVAFKVVNTTDAQTVTVIVTKVEHNVALDDALFVKK
jgi:outer membrane lipoprotein-sorting protein